MNALPMPISSRAAAARLSACFAAKSEKILAGSMGSAAGVAHDAVFADAASCASRIVQVMQVRDRLAHGEEGLVRVELAAKQHAEQLAGALRLALELARELLQPLRVVRLELRHPLVRAAKGLAVRRQHQHVGGQLEVALD